MPSFGISYTSCNLWWISLMYQWWRVRAYHWDLGAAYLVTSNLFFLILSTPGFSRSGSPFFPVCFLDFLFTAWLMVLAQCFGSSCMVEGETGKGPLHFFIPMSKQRDKSSILWKSYELLSCLLILLQKHSWGESSEHYLKRRGGVDICAWLKREHLGKFCFPKAPQFLEEKIEIAKGQICST